MVTLTPVGGTAQIKQGYVPDPANRVNPFTGIPGIILAKKDPTQVVGLTPLYPCSIDDCRFIDEDDVLNKVSGYVPDGSNATYKNDFTPLLVDFSIYSANPAQTSVSFLLQELVNGVWSTLATLNTNSFGIYYPLNTFKTHPTYAGFALNWGKVLNTHGPGTYRIKLESTYKLYSSCLVTDCFHLREFSCDWLHGTVKFERWITGIYGDPYVSYFQHDICDILWYDSFRYNGKFGNRKVKEYREERLKWGAPKIGKVDLVKDEAVLGYEFSSNYFKQPYHDRAQVYLMMGGETRVSDYNINSSDYNLKRVEMVKAGNWVPEYKDPLWRRVARVDVEFERGVQSIIHSICCSSRVVT